MPHFQNCIIMLAGDAPDAAGAKLLGKIAALENTLLLAADGGANYLHEQGLTPHLILGDGDSAAENIFPHVPRQKYPQKKNFSDGQATLDWAAEHCSGSIYIFGGFGGRLDHLLLNLTMPLHPPNVAVRVTFAGNGFTARYSNGSCCIEGAAGDLLSLIPLSRVRNICLSGLEYPLANYDADLGDSRLLSNVLLGKKATITHDDGWLLAIHYFGGIKT